MAYLHCWIWIPIPIPIWTARQMATLYYVEIFTLHGVGFKFQQTEMGSESGSELESGSVNENKPLHKCYIDSVPCSRSTSLSCRRGQHGSLLPRTR